VGEFEERNPRVGKLRSGETQEHRQECLCYKRREELQIAMADLKIGRYMESGGEAG
jgi:hypothetical protein